MKTKGYGYTVIGGRETNQDSFGFDDEAQIYAIADGVGGGLKGDVASQTAVQGVLELAGSSGSLRHAFRNLQEKIYAQAMEDFGEAIMGTTLTVVRIKNNEVSLCHSGDSRCYLINNYVLQQKSDDHETYDETNHGTLLISYLGIPEHANPLTIQEEKFNIEPGQKLLLCTDGLSRQLTENRIAKIMQEHERNPQEMLKILCAEAATVEFSDNVTVVLVVPEV